MIKRRQFIAWLGSAAAWPPRSNESSLTRLWAAAAENVRQVLRVPGPVLTTDEARRIAVNVARLPELRGEPKDIHGRDVLSAYAPVTPLGWLVFVEMPIEEAK